MLFNHPPFLSLLALSGLANAASLKYKRDDTMTLFCYGSQTNGAPVFYSNGYAYCGQTTLDGVSGTQTNITFAASTTDTTTPWTIAANSTSVTFNETLELYIVPTSGSFTQVGFTTSSDLPTDAVTTGFAWFGTSVAYAESDSNYELQFWAVASNTTGVSALYWNEDGTILDGAFPITIKSTPPMAA